MSRCKTSKMNLVKRQWFRVDALPYTKPALGSAKESLPHYKTAIFEEKNQYPQLVKGQWCRVDAWPYTKPFLGSAKGALDLYKTAIYNKRCNIPNWWKDNGVGWTRDPTRNPFWAPQKGHFPIVKLPFFSEDGICRFFSARIRYWSRDSISFSAFVCQDMVQPLKKKRKTSNLKVFKIA